MRRRRWPCVEWSMHAEEAASVKTQRWKRGSCVCRTERKTMSASISPWLEVKRGLRTAMVEQATRAQTTCRGLPTAVLWVHRRPSTTLWWHCQSPLAARGCDGSWVWGQGPVCGRQVWQLEAGWMQRWWDGKCLPFRVVLPEPHSS